jgi:hypothetical protein
MAKPLFFYTGTYDNLAGADADYQAIVVGIDEDGGQIERSLTRAESAPVG